MRTLLALFLLATAVQAKPPNVIFILCDDLGWGDLGVFHQNQSDHVRTHRTPHLDRMAAAGTQLRMHYCPAPVCAPSRASLLLGVHQGHCGVRDNQFDKELPDNHTIATVLKNAGYRTALIGKYGLQGAEVNGMADPRGPKTWPGYPTERGFDSFYGYASHYAGHVHYPDNQWPLGNSLPHRSRMKLFHNDEDVSDGLDKCYTTDLFTARGKKFVIDHTKQSPEQPFFLYLAYDTPHAALQIPTVPYPEGLGVSGGVQWLGEHDRMINTAAGEIDSYRHPDYTGHGWSDQAERFATMVRRIDDAVGDLLATLEDLEIAEDTIVVFSSDNGPHRESYIQGVDYAPTEFQSYGPFDGIKRDTWEGGVRVPALVWGPGRVQAGAVDETPSQFHDWLATFADAAGVPAPARTDGVSLLPTLAGAGQRRPSTVYVEYFQNGRTPDYNDFAGSHRKQRRGQMQVIHLDGHKGVRTAVKDADDDFRIYGLSADPKETDDLAASMPDLQRRMKERVLRLRVPNPTAARPYDGAAVPALPDAPTEPGVTCEIHPGRFPYVPSLAGSEPAKVVRQEHPSCHTGGPAAVVTRGLIRVPETGTYTFSLVTDQGAVMRIHDAAVIDADFGYESGQPAVGSLRLEQGLHPVTITALAFANEANVSLQWDDQDGDTVPLLRSR